MRSRTRPERRFGSPGQRHRSGQHVVREDDGERQYGQQQQSALQHDVEGQMEDIEAHVGAIERIGKSEGLAISETQKRIPLPRQGDRE